jgi:predicted nucleotidyltransferase
MEQLLKELIDRLKSQYGQRLISVILYGSAASGDQDVEYSDLNLLCVLDHIDAAALSKSEAIFRWWRENKQPLPLLMGRDEVTTSTDCFPIEFQDMKDRRKVLLGEDVIENLNIDFKFHRAQVEFELRTKLLRLRQQATVLLGRTDDALVHLCADSLSSFCVLGRHALLLSGVRVHPKKKDVIAQLEKSVGRGFDAYSELLAVREGKHFRGPIAESVRLFDNYLIQIQSVIDFVDRLEEKVN